VAVLLAASACTKGEIGEPATPPISQNPIDPNDPTDPVEPVEPEPPPFAPGPLDLRRILAREYVATVEDLFGSEAAALATPPADSAVNGLKAIGSTQLAPSDATIAAYEASARAIAQAANAGGRARTTFGACVPENSSDAACMRSFVETFGKRLFRRPLEAEESTRWVSLGVTAATRLEDFDGGVVWVIAGMLQSPYFLYRVELGAQDTADPARLRLSALELASRMSFFLTGAGPSAELLAQAERGELDTEAGVRTAALQMLGTEKSKLALAAFYDEVFRLGELSTLPKDSTLYPTFTPSLRLAMREETQKLIENIVWTENTDYRQLFSANYTYANAELARHSGLAEPNGGSFARIELAPSTKRGGLLGQSSFLSLFSHSVLTSPTLRGKFVREVLLCQAIPAPPPNVNTNLPPEVVGERKKTMRERLSQHQEDTACSGCHISMDGPGLGLENFDAIGAFRTEENATTIDAVSVMDDQTFEGAGQLGALVANNPRSSACIVRQLFRQAVGHVERPEETRALLAITESFRAGGHKLQSLLVEIVASEAFRFGTERDGE
jgi:hypothetical protein